MQKRLQAKPNQVTPSFSRPVFSRQDAERANTRGADRLTTPNALTACRPLVLSDRLWTRPAAAAFPQRAAAGEAAVGHQRQQSRHLRKKILCRQGLLGNNSLSCWSRLLQFVGELRAGCVCLHVWAPRRLELRALNGNINANQPFNLYKRNRGDVGGGWRHFSPVNADDVLSVCTVSFCFFVFSPRGERNVDNDENAENVYGGFKAAVFVFGRSDNSDARTREPLACTSKSFQTDLSAAAGERGVRGCLIWRRYREMFHPAKAKSDTMWRHRAWSLSKQWKLFFFFSFRSVLGGKWGRGWFSTLPQLSHTLSCALFFFTRCQTRP